MMTKWTTAVLLASCIFGSLALTAAVPVLAQRAGMKAAACKAQFGRGFAAAEAASMAQSSLARYSCQATWV